MFGPFGEVYLDKTSDPKLLTSSSIKIFCIINDQTVFQNTVYATHKTFDSNFNKFTFGVVEKFEKIPINLDPSFGYKSFLITFNTIDGRKNLASVDDVSEIDSIVIEYNIQDLCQSMNHEVYMRRSEVNILKQEHALICELIMAFKSGNEAQCQHLRKENKRLELLHSESEMYEEFKIVNEQIGNHKIEINNINKKCLQIQNNEHKDDIKIEIPYGTIAKIRMCKFSYQEPGFENVVFDCYWKYGDTDK